MSAGNDFALDLNKFVEKAGEAANAAIKDICLDLTSRIILKTPVDTGRARANWQTSIGNPITTTIEFSKDAGSNAIAPNQSAGSHFAIASAQMMAFQAPGNVFYISNNLPYIASLEFGLYSTGPKTVGGFSRQAPSGMVRISINEISRALRL